MSLTDLLLSQLSDPFRIGLVAALVLTMVRTRAVTGTLVPLGAGILFVAVIIPATMAQTLPLPLWQVVAVGLVANAVILAVVLAIWTAIRRARG